VLPQLPPHAHYLVAGVGAEEEPLRAAAQRLGLSDRVHLLGRVDDQAREQLLHGADLFVQPNVAVPGDMEGFGLVVVEAALRGLPVVAADLEGIKDAVVPDVTGLLLPSGDAAAWVETVTRLLVDPQLSARGAGFRDGARASFNEDVTAGTLLPALGLPVAAA
jgi:phosphatidylinositol alpha-1,6-mannosyltransferase